MTLRKVFCIHQQEEPMNYLWLLKIKCGTLHLEILLIVILTKLLRGFLLKSHILM